MGHTAPRRPRFRVVVTGSRKWPYPLLVHQSLTQLHELTLSRGLVLIVREGECASGPDLSAVAWTHAAGLRYPGTVRIDPYAADWRSCAPSCPPGHFRRGRCMSAGIRRNMEMIDAGAEMCMAFIADRSSGASHCADYAQRNGVGTVRWTTMNGELAEPDRSHWPPALIA